MLKRVERKGRRGYQWNDGRVFYYTTGDPKSRTSAKNRALKQGKALKATKKKRKQ